MSESKVDVMIVGGARDADVVTVALDKDGNPPQVIKMYATRSTFEGVTATKDTVEYVLVHAMVLGQKVYFYAQNKADVMYNLVASHATLGRLKRENPWVVELLAQMEKQDAGIPLVTH